MVSHIASHYTCMYLLCRISTQEVLTALQLIYFLQLGSSSLLSLYSSSSLPTYLQGGCHFYTNSLGKHGFVLTKSIMAPAPSCVAVCVRQNMA